MDEHRQGVATNGARANDHSEQRCSQDGRTDAPLSSDPYAGFERAARNAGMVEGARHLRGLGMDAAADALYAEAARRAGL